MNFLEPTIREALFFDAEGPDWIGRVSAVSIDRECVPLLVDHVKYIVEFALPPPAQPETTAPNLPFKRANGLPFLAALDYRGIAIWSNIDGTHEDLKCVNGDERSHDNLPKLIDMLQRAIKLYIATHPQISQYFCPNFWGGGKFIEERLLAEGSAVASGKRIVALRQTDSDYFGFSIETE